MAKFTIELGGAQLRVSDSGLVAIPPNSYDGRHLTIPWAPQPSGRYAGQFTPHVTFPKRRQRRTIGRFQPDEISAIFEKMSEEMVLFWAGASRLVTTDSLGAAGWVVLGFDEVVQERLQQFLLVRPNHLRVSLDEADEEWMEVCNLLLERSVDPRDMRPGIDTDGPRFMFRVLGEVVENAMLGYYPHGLFGPPGWYVTRQEDFADQMFREIFMRRASAKLVRALIELTRFFGGSAPAELLELARNSPLVEG